jgi:hypothetical protein
MKRSVSSIILTMAWAIATPSQAVLADKLHLQASFAVAFAATPNSPPVAYCGGPALDFKVEAHGNGYSSFGALAFFLQKTISADGALHGCLTLSTPDGDSLFATYDGTEGEPNTNNFNMTNSGTLTFTGGTGLFNGAKGKATFTAVFAGLYPGSSFASGTGTAPLQGIAFYVVDGKVSAGRGD